MRIKRWQRKDHVSSPFLAEALVMRETLGEAHEREWQSLCFKSDAKELIQAIKIETYRKEIYGIIKDIKQLSMFYTITFEYVTRSDNVLADALPKGALDVHTIIVL